ncbi:MAG: DegT/DnrJ/EryC1/StrS family aminotransferase [bacterium]|jgi:dTDP-4-amino-4,6-dideoxygalactose transaminase|nr:DegT/DnrJ/EryC1/StrS family aminotransferase [bacterium]
MWKIPLFELHITPEDQAAVLEPLQANWLTMGEQTKKFEAVFAERLGSKYAFAVSNGTAALHLALIALGIGPGDEVLVPSLTFVACANVIKAVGATPVFVDIENEVDWTLSAADLERKITPRSKAVMLVHYAGFPCNYDKILPIAKKFNLRIVEDCAHALVTQTPHGYCGTVGDMGCFSFFSNKNMTTGEGGMIIAQAEELADRLRMIRSHGMTTLTLDRYQGRAVSYDVMTYGLNYRSDEMHSALGLSQFQRLDANLTRRLALFQAYQARLGGLDEIILPFQDKVNASVGIHIFPIALRTKDRAAVMSYLKDQGIQSSIHYPPIHRFTAYQNDETLGEAFCPLTERISATEITLPFYPEMTDEMVGVVCDTVKAGLQASA